MQKDEGPFARPGFFVMNVYTVDLDELAIGLNNFLFTHQTIQWWNRDDERSQCGGETGKYERG
jgi:hypothetical protein